MRGAIIFLVLLGILAIIPSTNAQGEDTTKAIIMDFNIKDGKITYLGSRVVYNYPPENIAHKDFNIKIFSTVGELIKELGIEDPRIVYHEEGAAIEDDVNFSVIVPFYPESKKVEIYNGTTNELMISVDISRIISDFCNEHPEDQQCKKGETTPTKSTPGFEATLTIIAFLAVMCIMSWRTKMR